MLLGLMLALASLGSPDQAVASLTDATALALVAQVPVIQEAGDAASTQITRSMMIPASDGRGAFAEVTWRSGDQLHVGLAMIARTDLDPDMEWVVADGDWGVLKFEEGRTWDDLIAELQGAQQGAQRSRAIGQLRMVLAAQVAFASFNGDGAYASSLACLIEPSSCGFELPPMLDPSFQEADRMGHRFTLHASPDQPAGGSPHLASHFAFTAVRIDPQESGARGLCVDDTGAICEFSGDVSHVVEAGRCANSCTPVP